jgi:hypothetical protein
MAKAGLSTDIILAKIQASAGSFDTSPAELSELKSAGVPEAVILAMVKSQNPARPKEEPTHVTVPEGARTVHETKADRTGERVWTSTTTGNDWKIRVDGDYMYIERVNLPAALDGTTAFVRTELKKTGDKWAGQTHYSLPVNYHGEARWCSGELRTEITRVLETSIEGRAEQVVDYNVRKCEPKKLEWMQFTWIPKE